MQVNIVYLLVQGSIANIGQTDDGIHGIGGNPRTDFPPVVFVDLVLFFRSLVNSIEDLPLKQTFVNYEHRQGRHMGVPVNTASSGPSWKFLPRLFQTVWHLKMQVCLTRCVFFFFACFDLKFKSRPAQTEFLAFSMLEELYGYWIYLDNFWFVQNQWHHVSLFRIKPTISAFASLDVVNSTSSPA